MQPRIFQINFSNGGVPKTGLHTAEVGPNGIVIDRHDDMVHHGGPEQNLCLYSLERIDALQREGHPIFPGSTGENITTVGLDPELFLPGRRFRLGADIVIVTTDFAQPCKTIRDSFIDFNFNRINELKHPGWSRIYARVLETGSITVGDSIILLD